MKKNKLRQLTALMGEGVVRPGALVVDADDLGLTRGDGCFDATRVRTYDDGVSEVDDLDEHLARLNASITGLGAEPDDLDPWHELVAEAAEAWANPGEAVLKLMWTRGRESTGSDPVRMLTITPLSNDAIEQRQGISVVTLSRGMASDAFDGAPWLLGGVKSLSYAVNKAALREASRRGADDVVFTSTDGYCLEGPTSALLVLRGGTLWSTPTGATGILDSITLRKAFRGATKHDVRAEYNLLKPKDVLKADGAWLLSSVRGVAPIVQLDGTAIAQDEKLTRRLQKWTGFGG